MLSLPQKYADVKFFFRFFGKPNNLVRMFHNSFNVAGTGPRDTVKKRLPSRRARDRPSPCLIAAFTVGRGPVPRHAPV